MMYVNLNTLVYNGRRIGCDFFLKFVVVVWGSEIHGVDLKFGVYSYCVNTVKSEELDHCRDSHTSVETL